MVGWTDGWTGEQKMSHLFLPYFHAAIMVHMNILANALKGINNAEKKDKLQVPLGQAPKSSSGF